VRLQTQVRHEKMFSNLNQTNLELGTQVDTMQEQQHKHLKDREVCYYYRRSLVHRSLLIALALLVRFNNPVSVDITEGGTR
jgi:hypothetical protein